MAHRDSETSSGRMMYQYKVLTERYFDAEEALNVYADDGWRVVSSTAKNDAWIIYTLEREVCYD